SFTAKGTSPAKATDGNYWYHRDPPNRWTCEGSPNASDWLAVDLGTPRTIHTAKLYFLDDGKGVAPPVKFDLEHWDGQAWKAIPAQKRAPARPAGHQAHTVRFAPLETAKVRAVFYHSERGAAGVTEFEAWRDVADAKKWPEQPAGGVFNEVKFRPVTASKVRRVCTHAGKARSGVTEVLVWAE